MQIFIDVHSMVNKPGFGKLLKLYFELTLFPPPSTAITTKKLPMTNIEKFSDKFYVTKSLNKTISRKCCRRRRKFGSSIINSGKNLNKRWHFVDSETFKLLLTFFDSKKNWTNLFLKILQIFYVYHPRCSKHHITKFN